MNVGLPVLPPLCVTLHLCASLPLSMSLTLLPTWKKCGFFKSLVVGLPYSPIFWWFLVISVLKSSCNFFCSCVRKQSVFTYASVSIRSPPVWILLQFITTPFSACNWLSYLFECLFSVSPTTRCFCLVCPRRRCSMNMWWQTPHQEEKSKMNAWANCLKLSNNSSNFSWPQIISLSPGLVFITWVLTEITNS